MNLSKRLSARTLAVLACAAALGSTLTACAPLVVGAAVGSGVLVATDRRTSGAQLEDQGIEMRAASRLREQFGDRARVIVTSYNRRVLLTGEVPSEADRATANRLVAGVENVREIVDELGVQSSPSFTARSSDSLVTARVKAALLDARDLSANAFKVVTERGTTYLMGRVTAREADRATDVTRSISGVQRVVRVFELISEEELARITPAPANGGSTR
ncbi:BON domain-containing protein [Aquabacterium sp. A08]|uniref:BON domain-containing protein n=1 Tax=Aquabacterium sp. A08 TaxID=2718532 RepID=UPI0014228C9A|nr:BON domain-containing protein [Aquabacterium sp. A08]NIC40290.1 BON domain-containing protein [Aquabacterium sp. A08]